MGRLGLIVPSWSTVNECEFQRVINPTISVHAMRVRIEADTEENFIRMSKEVPGAPKLLAQAKYKSFVTDASREALYKDRDTTKRPFVRSRAQPDFLEWLRCRRGALFDPPSDEAFRKALRRSLDKSVKLIEVGGNINDEAVAAAMVESLLGMVKPVHSQAI